MIKIEFTEPTTDEWKAWRHDCDEARTLVIRQMAQGNKPEITDLYKDPRMKKVYKSRGPPFYGKCAYCESDVLVNYPGDIEHFRPKNQVTDENAKPILIRTGDGRTAPHPGYPWLAYDWRNLLLACKDCNSPSKFKTAGNRIGKWDQFPVRGFRAVKEGDEENEEELLVNPTKEDPSNHLDVDDIGAFVAQTDRGQTCIDIFGLNVREALVNARKTAIRCARNQMNLAIVAVATGGDAKTSELQSDFTKIREGSAPFAAAGRMALRKEKERHEKRIAAL